MIDETLKKLNYERAMAVRKESIIRESSFLPITLDIAGIEVNQFNFNHYVLLDFLNNPILNGGNIESADILTFIWVVSTQYKPNDKVAFDEFVATKCLGIDYDKAFDECVEYLSNGLMDIGGDTNPENIIPKSNKTPYYSWIVTYIDLIASQYGWTPEYIMKMPVAQVFQYSRIIEERLSAANGKKVQFANKLSDSANAAILKYLQNKAETDNKILVLPDKE